jgi:hypothetical protein
MFAGLAAGAPARKHLQHWERVCRYLDAQPYRAIKAPFPTDPPITARLLKRMARFGLVRHCDDCTWRVTRRWATFLRKLWQGQDEEEEGASPPLIARSTAPFVADHNVDTMYVNLLALALPEQLVADCARYKALAQEADQPVETSWRIFDAPLSMWKAGVGTSQKGGGVSWSFLLRNAYVMVRLRKTPLQRLIGSVRLSAECLWTYGPRASLDGVRDALGTMWAEKFDGTPDEAAQAFEREVTWRLSQLHLCADVANFAPEPADLERIVTHSRKRAVHIPSREDEELAALIGLSNNGDEDDFAAFLAGAPEEWVDLPAEFLTDDGLALDAALFDDGDDTNDSDGDAGDTSNAVDEDGEEEEEEPADTVGTAVHLWGRRASGFAFSPGGALSAAWYNKALEERLSGKRWMEDYHRAGGWTPEMSLCRVEGRFTREVFREIAVALGLAEGDWCDDPWLAIAHYNDFWAHFVGLPPEHDHAPDATHRGWMRLTCPLAGDTNRSRWPTDPVWELLQRVSFAESAPPVPLRRARQVVHDLDQIDAELYGLFKLRSVIASRQQHDTLTLSQELGAFARRMEEVDAEKDRDYYEEVREKARMLGRAVPIRSRSVLAG